MKNIKIGSKLPDNKSPFLPGGSAPIRFFLNEVQPHEGSLLILGNGFTEIVPHFLNTGFSPIHAASDDNTEIFGFKANTPKDQQVPALYVEYTSLDHKTESFDFVFCQATLTLGVRNKLVKEIKRVLKPGGHLITTEILCNKKPAPTFLNDIWADSGQDPLFTDDFEPYYTSRNFEVVKTADFTDELDEFYIKSFKMLESNLKSVSAEQRQKIRKEFAGEKHEITSLVKGGALKYMNLKTMILKKL